MKKILFYYPSNQRTISIESVILEFKKQGHHVILLTQTEKSDLHLELESNGVETYTFVQNKQRTVFYYFKHLIFLIKFCKSHKVNIVYSHLQQANIISVFAQFFCSPKFYVCRHHSSVSGADSNFNQTLFDRIINKLAKVIIVPSKMVYTQVCSVEGVKPDKVKLINYGYDFTKYPAPNNGEVEKIKEHYSSKLLLVKVARLVSGKRYDILFDVIKKMVIDDKKDIKLLVISEGPLMDDFKSYIKINQLNNHIFLLGNVTNVIDYLSAADAVPLLSEAEASNNVIKEAGLVKKCVLVCKGVGDFEDYIEDNFNGLLLDKNNPKPELLDYLNKLYDNRISTNDLGKQLHEQVINIFSIEENIHNYTHLNS